MKNSKRPWWILPALLLCGLMFGASGCWRSTSQDSESPQPVKTLQAPRPVNKLVANAYNEFGFDLLRHLEREEEGNLLISPLSVSIALAMTYNGAAGETQKEIAKTLHLNGIQNTKINQASAAMLHNLNNATAKVESSAANSLWAQQGFRFKDSFLKISRESYDAEVATVNFGSSQDIAKINDWISRATRGKIKGDFQPSSSQTLAVLINALYFKGEWTEKFDKSLTEDDTFTLSSGTTKQVPFMSQSGTYKYLKGADFQVVALPYGEADISLYILLPAKSASLQTLTRKLNGRQWNGWMSRLSLHDGTIRLPRFKAKFAANLTEVLQEMGMQTVFTPSAGFSALSNEKLWISQVQHQSVMEVDEEGTVATAETEVEGTNAANSFGEEETPFSFVANRPFFCALRDNRGGSLLFLCAVREP